MNEVQLNRLAVLGAKEWPYYITTYVMSIMATYLTGVWELSITHAAQIMNVYSGTVVILPIVMNKILCCMSSLRVTAFVSKFAFVLGFVLLTISASGTCNEDEPLCVGTAKKILFYTAMSLVAVAVSTHETWSEPLLTRSMELFNMSDNQALIKFGYAMIPLGAVGAIGYISPWWIKFLIPTIFAAVSSLLWLDLVADNTVITVDLEADPSALIEKKVDKVDSPRRYLYALYACICSILVSLVFTVGNTFFILQATDLRPYVYTVKITAVALPIIKDTVKKTCSLPCLGFPLGLITSMIFATLCCITAAKVETRRLVLVNSEGVVDDPDAIIPMTMLWLVPQYILLGLAEVFLEHHLEFGLIYLFNEALRIRFKPQVTGKIITSLGFFCGVLSVFIVGKVKPTWIQDTLNTSRLDNYYWLLATISAANLLLFVLVGAVLLAFLSIRNQLIRRRLAETT